jgi:hypothetical protein
MSYVDTSQLGPMSALNQISYNYYTIDVQYDSTAYDTNDGAQRPNKSGTPNPMPASGTCSGLRVSNYIPPSPSNLSYPRALNTYKSSDVFIIGQLHNILNISWDATASQSMNGIVGELIIKHTPVATPTAGKNLYLCFFLSYRVSAINLTSSNDIDAMINQIVNGAGGAVSTSLNKCIPAQNGAIQYFNNNGENVIVFTNPITINKTSNDILKQFVPFKNTPAYLLPIPPTNVLKMTSDNIITGTEDNIYMDCQPTGVSSDEIQTYSVPINSEYTKNAAQIDLMATVVQLSMVFTVIVISYFVTPRLYKWAIIDNVNKFTLNGDDEKSDPDWLHNNRLQNSRAWIAEALKKTEGDDKDKPTYGIDTHIRIATVDVLISAFLMLLFFATLTNGLSNNFDFNSIMAGIYFIIFFIMSTATIQFNKMSGDYLKTKIEPPNEVNTVKLEGHPYPLTQGNKEVLSFFYFSDLGVFFGEVIKFISNDKWFGAFCAFLLICFIIILAVVNGINGLSNTAKGLANITTVFGTILFIVIYGIVRMMRLSRKQWNNDLGK